MRAWPMLIAMLLCAGCSCQRSSTATEGSHSDRDTTAAADAIAAVPASDPDGAAEADAPPSASNPRTVAASTVHGYLHALLESDRSRSDAFWAGGKPPPQPDDAVLRSLEGIRSLRVNNDAGIALDQERPTRALEIPVRLRVSTDDGVRQLRGWYRVRQRVDGSGWEITSASLQPVLD